MYGIFSNEGYLYQRDDGRIYMHENESDDTFLLRFADRESAELFRQELQMSDSVQYDWKWLESLEVVVVW